MTATINRMQSFYDEQGKVNQIIVSCKTLEQTRSASKCIDLFSGRWGTYDGPECIQDMRDDLCDKTFEIFIETKRSK